MLDLVVPVAVLTFFALPFLLTGIIYRSWKWLMGTIIPVILAIIYFLLYSSIQPPRQPQLETSLKSLELRLTEVGIKHVEVTNKLKVAIEDKNACSLELQLADIGIKHVEVIENKNICYTTNKRYCYQDQGTNLMIRTNPFRIYLDIDPAETTKEQAEYIINSLLEDIIYRISKRQTSLDTWRAQ
jgi:YbbR domain-containing protein